MWLKIDIKTKKVVETYPDFLQQKSSDIVSFCIFSQWDWRKAHGREFVELR